MKKIYLASPFFTDKERKFKKRIKKKLETCGYDVIDPQGGGEPRSWEESNPEWGARIFDKDINLINKADYLIAVDWGLYSDTGTAFEVGYAFSEGKEIIVIVPDEVLSEKHSLMIANSTNTFICESRFFDYANDLDNLLGCRFYLNGITQQ